MFERKRILPLPLSLAVAGGLACSGGGPAAMSEETGTSGEETVTGSESESESETTTSESESGSETGPAGPTPDYACLIDADCEPERYCVLNVCVDGCSSDADCDSGDTCDPHGRCTPPVPPAPPSVPDAPLGVLVPSVDLVELDAGATSFTFELVNGSSVEPVRYRLLSAASFLSFDEAPDWVQPGESATVTVVVDTSGVSTEERIATLDIKSDAGQSSLTVVLPFEPTGHYGGTVSLGDTHAFGGSDLGVDLTFNPDNTLSGSTYSDESFFWPRDMVVNGTWESDGSLTFTIEDQVAPSAPSGVSGPFFAPYGRSFAFAGQLDQRSGTISGAVVETLTGLGDDMGYASGDFSLTRAGGLAASNTPEDDSSLVPMGVPVDDWNTTTAQSACADAGAALAFIASGSIVCDGCEDGSCPGATQCADALMAAANGIGALISGSSIPPKTVWEDCVDGQHDYAGGPACYDRAAVACAGDLYRQALLSVGSDPVARVAAARDVVYHARGEATGGHLVAMEREIGAVLSFQQADSELSDELAQIEDAVVYLDHAIATVASPGYPRALALLGLDEIHDLNGDEDLLRVADIVERWAELKTLEWRLRVRNSGLTTQNREALRYMAIWVHAMAVTWDAQFDYFQVADDRGAIDAIGMAVLEFKRTYDAFGDNSNEFGRSDTDVLVFPGGLSNYDGVKSQIQPAVTGQGGLAEDLMQLVTADAQFWATAFQQQQRRTDLVNQFDDQLKELCGRKDDPVSGEVVPDLTECGSETGVLFELMKRVESASVSIEQANAALAANEQLVRIEEERMAAILANFDEVQMSLDELRGEIFNIQDQAGEDRSAARESAAKRDCARVKDYNAQRRMREGAFCGAKAAAQAAGLSFGNAAAQAIECVANDLELRAQANESCDAAHDAAWAKNAMDDVNLWEQQEITTVNNMIDDLLRQSQYAEQQINSEAQIKSLMVNTAELYLRIVQAEIDAEVALSQHRAALARVVDTVRRKRRTLAMFDADPANSPAFLVARLESARQALTKREQAYGLLFDLLRAAEYEFNQMAPELRRELARLRNPADFQGFITQCLDSSVSNYTFALGTPQADEHQISLRDDVLGLDEPVIDPATGLTVTPAEQFRALMQDPAHQTTDGRVAFPITLSLVGEDLLFNSQNCNDRIESITAMVVGDFIGDSEIDLLLRREGATFLRRCDAAPGTENDRSSIESYSFSPRESVLAAGANTFPMMLVNTAYQRWPVGGDRWVIYLDPDQADNQDVNLNSVSDIVLKIRTNSHTVNPASLASFTPQCL